MSAAASALPDGLPAPRRYWAAAAFLTCLSLVVLDASIANVALPSIAADLKATASDAVWVANAYSLTIVLLLLPMSAVAERVGFKRMFVFGVLIFTAASLGCAMSGTLWHLVIARVLQGVGGATLMSMFGGMVRNIYPSYLLGRGISLNSATVATMSVVGPALGSVILSVASWRWVFAVNLPIGVLVLCCLRFLPDVPRIRMPLDWISALLSMATIGLFITGVDALGKEPAQALAQIAAAAVLGVVLVRRVRRQPSPLVPVDLLRIKPFAYAAAASVCTFAAQTGAYVAAPFYFEQVLGRQHLEVGVLIAAWPVGTVLMALISGRLADRYPVALLSGTGAGVMVLGLAWLALMPLSVSNTTIMACMFLVGLGFGFFQAPNNRAMLSAAPRERSGAAGGLQATTRVFGQSFGTALVAVAFGMAPSHGPVTALLLAAACAAMAVVVNMVRSAKLAQPVAQ
jgi:DHA2 family multidrug resistance protein-like MFS transporter